MKFKGLIGFLVFALVLLNFSELTYAESDEEASINRLINISTIETHDGMYDESYGLGLSEGAIYLKLDSQSDLDLFKLLSNEGKKKVLVGIAQANWGDYLGVDICYSSVIYNNKLYASSEVLYDSDFSNVKFQYYEQGITDLKPWKNKTTTSKNTNTSNSNSELETSPNKNVSIKEIGVVLKNNTMVPAASVFKNFNASFQMDSKTKDIKIKYNNTTMVTKLNSKYAKINGVNTSYTVAPQIIEGKLMVPVQLIKDLFKAKVSVETDTYDYNKKYIKSVTLSTSTVKVTVPINDLYETYKKYYDKTAWIHTPQLIISDLNGKFITNIKNLSSVKITSISRDEYLGDWLNIQFVYKGKTYKANLQQYRFNIDFYFTSPYKDYNFSKKVWNKIENHEISIGMNEDMVYLSWGLYDRHLENNYSWGSTDLWVYEEYVGGDKYLYFSNGILESISTY